MKFVLTLTVTLLMNYAINFSLLSIYIVKIFLGVVPTNPCVPSPCGPNSECRVIGDQAACSCLPNYIGRVPNCRPECTIDPECPSNTACINERCKDPCQEACGVNALCLTINHKPVCSCQQGFTGDAVRNCVQILISCTYFLHVVNVSLLLFGRDVQCDNDNLSFGEAKSLGPLQRFDVSCGNGHAE